MLVRLGKLFLVLIFFGYLALLGSAAYFHKTPVFSTRSPFVVFCPAERPQLETLCAESEPSPIVSADAIETVRVAIPEQFRTAESEEKFGQASETITTYYPPAVSPIVTAPPPIWYSTPVYGPSYIVGSPPPVFVLPPPVIVRRPFFQALFP